MRIVRSALVVTLLLAGANAARAAEQTTGALDQSKQELRQLQSDQKSKTRQTSDKVRVSTPVMEVQPGQGSAESWLANKQAKEKKLREGRASANPNWLAEGVEKLEKEEAQAKTPETAITKESAPKESVTQPVNQADPQYLLKLFDEQKKTGEAKSTGKTSATPAPDPFAPFMESWLGSSPTRGQFFDQTVRKSEVAPASAPAGGTTDYRRLASTSAAPAGLPEKAVVEKSNPYLADLNTPVLSKEIVAETSQLQPALGPSTPAAQVPASAVSTQPTTPLRETRERPKAPPSGLVDDKKYFPQLKRF